LNVVAVRIGAAVRSTARINPTVRIKERLRMTTFNWFGGQGNYTAARFWNPRGVPGAGDTAVVGAGEMVVAGRQVGATVLLGSPDSAGQPVLDLRNASLAGLSMPNALPPPPYSTSASPTQYGTVNVRGHSSIGSLAIGNFSGESRAPAGIGHGPLTAPDVLTVNLEGQARLATRFDVKDGSTLTVNGGGRYSLAAGNSVIESGTVVVNAPLNGQGTILMVNGLGSHEGYGHAGSLELGGPVGAGETIGIDVGNVVIDRPMEFAGTLDFQPDVGSGGFHYTATQGVLLKGLTASSYAFDNAAHALTLFNGDAVLDTIRFSQGTTSDSFHMGQFASIDVLQTGGGVYLRGSYNFTQGTEIPLHAASAAA
jgi:hypothetical protein